MTRKTSRLILISILSIIALIFGIGVGYLAWTIKTAPDISQIAQFKPSETSTIYSVDGEVLDSLYAENRIYVPLSKIPMDVQNAIVASEDQKFWDHPGINIWGIMRSLYVDIITMSKAQGGSTLTQLLARNIALHQKKTWTRKIQEAYIAIQLERMYTKEEILEMILNHIFFGHSALGIETAAQQYFGKNVEDLTLGESAMLIGIMPSPNRYSPYNNLDLAKQRRAKVLKQMVDLGYISEDRATQANQEEFKLVGLDHLKDKTFAPYFNYYVRDQLIKMFGSDTVYRGGLRVYTTLDTQMQAAAEEALNKALDPENGYLPTSTRDKGNDPTQPQVAMISIDPRTGYINAMIGGRGNDKFNRAIQSTRQPGSAIKPLVYATALEQGYSPGDILYDIPKHFDPSNTELWPTNYDNNYAGPVSLRYALAHSSNAASVSLLEKVGVRNSIDLAERFQINSLVKTGVINDQNLGFVLGGLTKGTSPIQLASAYGIFANRGIYVEPLAITKVEDSEGHVLFEATPSQKIVYQEDAAYLMTSMLCSVVTDGTGWQTAIQGRQVAGKTGTTSDNKDAWYVGFTPDIVTAVWIGEDYPRAMIYDETDENGDLIFSENGRPLKVSSGEAARLWGEYMRAALAGKEILHFPRPDNIIEVTIDPITGELPNYYTPKTVTELYREGYEPTQKEQLHQPMTKAKIDTATWQLATSQCPTENVVEYNFQQGSGIMVGPAKFKFTINPGEEDERPFNFVFPTGAPVNQINPETAAPVLDTDGNFLYNYKPTVRCQEHSTSAAETIQTGTKKLIDTIWNFFNSRGNSD